MKPLRTAVIGISGFARTHLKSIAAHPDQLSLSAVVIRLPRDDRADEESRERELVREGVRVYRSHSELLRAEQGRIDLVTIPCGIPEHCELSIDSLEAGYDVLCEKPAAGNLADALRMFECSRRTRKTLMIGYQHLLRPSTQLIKDTALRGRFGKLLSARTLLSWPRDHEYYSRNRWAGRLAVDGKGVFDSPLQNAAAHFFQNMLYVAGETRHGCAEPIEVYAENYHIAQIESADTQFVRARLHGGVELVFVASHAAPETVEPVTEYLFERGRITWEISGRTEFFLDGTEEVYDDRLDDPHDLPFLEAVAAAEGREPRSTIENAVQHARCVDAAFRSSGGIVELDPALRASGLLPALELAYEERKGFAELGLPWARPGRILAL
ncbi:MAG TPA: Gfo/Idh/MocA family oxidoreductase [Spirochaetia bacterium]|nr:Gfo/Idh/MocA family oxidoreductase [Spirochaetia bacterium]